MTPSSKPRTMSLGGRLLAVSAFFTLVTLAVALVVMQTVLQRFVTGQIDQRLDDKIAALVSQLQAEPDGILKIVGDANGPPFDTPRRNAFWFVSGPKNDLMTGWLKPGDFTPPTPREIAAVPSPPAPMRSGEAPGPNPGKPKTLVGIGPNGTAVHLRVARPIVADRSVTIMVATPAAAIAGPIREATTTVMIAFTGLGLTLLAAAFVQVRLGLRPLGRLLRQIADVRSGASDRVPVDQPREVLPLVIELNSLLRQNTESLVRARRHVANLAHGLKTPLATLSLAAERMEGEDSAPLRDLVGMMERRIRHHLGRARAAALDGVSRNRTPLAARLRDLTGVLRHIHADKAITVVVDCADQFEVACEPQDVDEILGNLLDNAFKYTRTRVACAVRDADRTLVVTIADDGEGLDDREIERVMHPGQRIDETVPGFGFGLPIARELVELYGGSLALARGPVGLVVTLVLPRAL